jgi:hypothetical protein
MNDVTMPEILSILASNGGEFNGTYRLLELINSSPITIKQSLSHARERNLIRTTNNQGGRGNHARHCLTTAGWRKADELK